MLVALFVRHAWRAPRPLIDVRLFRVPAFTAAAATTFLVGGALFGAMIILPLYYQVARGEIGADGGPADGARRASARPWRCRSPGGSPTASAAAAWRWWGCVI